MTAMSHDPMDVHVDKAAFWAAYRALQRCGVTLAEVRGEAANRIAVAVLAQRTAYGLDRVSALAEDSDTRLDLVSALKADMPKMFTTVTKLALDDAVAAAAGELAGT